VSIAHITRLAIFRMLPISLSNCNQTYMTSYFSPHSYVYPGMQAVRKNRGFSIFSPFERVAKDSMPTSIPTASSVCKSFFCRVGSGSYSTEKETSHFLVRERLYCTCIDPFPPIRRCRTTVTSQFLKEKESVLLHQA